MNTVLIFRLSVLAILSISFQLSAFATEDSSQLNYIEELSNRHIRSLTDYYLDDYEISEIEHLNKESIDSFIRVDNLDYIEPLDNTEKYEIYKCYFSKTCEVYRFVFKENLIPVQITQSHVILLEIGEEYSHRWIENKMSHEIAW